MIQTYKVSIEGVMPLITHNSAMVDPANPFTAAIKELTAKKGNKTDADLEDIKRLEWFGGLYVDGEAGPKAKADQLGLPEEVIMAVIVKGATKTRKGKDAQAGVIVNQDFVRLNIPSAKGRTLAQLYEDDEFRFFRSVKVGQSRVMRMRPRFSQWSCSFELDIMTDILNAKNVREWIETSGRQCGIGERRPRYGRFTLTAWEKVA